METSARERFLKAFHAAYPMATSQTFGLGRTSDGGSSHEVLAERVTGSERVLDLGCGDGVLLDLLAAPGRQLTGIAISPESLAVARRRPALAGARLVEDRAQQLLFARNSFDACVSHMVLMLMNDVDAVAVEIARALVPGGTLACGLGGGAAGGEAFALFLTLLRRVIESAPPEQQVPPMGDQRTRDRAGMEKVLRPAGFGPVSWDTVVIDLSMPVDQLWPVVSSSTTWCSSPWPPSRRPARGIHQRSHRPRLPGRHRPVRVQAPIATASLPSC